MVAIEDFNIDARLGHPARELPKLTGFGLIQPLYKDLPFVEDADPSGFECFASSDSILK
jgi:hypothetical protein